MSSGPGGRLIVHFASAVSEFDEKTRVTQVVHPSPPEEGTGNDCLVVIYTKEGGLLGKRFVLDGTVLRVGRGADNQVVLEGDSVSRRHAHFEQRPTNRWWVVDDGSTNGTYVNEEQIDHEAMLRNADRIKVGPTIFKYLSGADAEAKYHEEIYHMTIVDGLTQIHNKRYLSEALDREVLRARRHQRELSVLMFDIDFFKNVNDQFGHLAGDYVLRELAKVVQERIRRDEVFARYGGEEFCIVLPETSLAGAAALAEDLRQRVEAHSFVFQSERMPVTISVGCALIAPSDRTAADLIQRADEKLYEAKRSGRNRVCQ
jgi:two-component system cell cycle response regulator